MKKLIIILMLLMAMATSEAARTLPIVAKPYIDYNEKANRDEIIEWLGNANVKTNKVVSWCAAFARKMLDIAGYDNFKVRSGLAKAYITKNSIKAKHVAKGYVKLDHNKDYLAIWTHGNTWKGHIGIVESWATVTGITIEGNTSKTVSGNQRSGGWVQRKQRSIVDYAQFRIIYFTEVSRELR